MKLNREGVNYTFHRDISPNRLNWLREFVTNSWTNKINVSSKPLVIVTKGCLAAVFRNRAFQLIRQWRPEQCCLQKYAAMLIVWRSYILLRMIENERIRNAWELLWSTKQTQIWGWNPPLSTKHQFTESQATLSADDSSVGMLPAALFAEGAKYFMSTLILVLSQQPMPWTRTQRGRFAWNQEIPCPW